MLLGGELVGILVGINYEGKFEHATMVGGFTDDGNDDDGSFAQV